MRDEKIGMGNFLYQLLSYYLFEKSQKFKKIKKTHLFDLTKLQFCA